MSKNRSIMAVPIPKDMGIVCRPNYLTFKILNTSIHSLNCKYLIFDSIFSPLTIQSNFKYKYLKQYISNSVIQMQHNRNKIPLGAICSMKISSTQSLTQYHNFNLIIKDLSRQSSNYKA